MGVPPGAGWGRRGGGAGSRPRLQAPLEPQGHLCSQQAAGGWGCRARGPRLGSPLLPRPLCPQKWGQGLGDPVGSGHLRLLITASGGRGRPLPGPVTQCLPRVPASPPHAPGPSGGPAVLAMPPPWTRPGARSPLSPQSWAGCPGARAGLLGGQGDWGGGRQVWMGPPSLAPRLAEVKTTRGVPPACLATCTAPNCASLPRPLEDRRAWARPHAGASAAGVPGRELPQGLRSLCRTVGPAGGGVSRSQSRAEPARVPAVVSGPEAARAGGRLCWPGSAPRVQGAAQNRAGVRGQHDLIAKRGSGERVSI